MQRLLVLLLLATSATSCADILGDDFVVSDDEDGAGDDGDVGAGSGQQPQGCASQGCQACGTCVVENDCRDAYDVCWNDFACSGMLLCQFTMEDPCPEDCGFSCLSSADCNACFGAPPAFDAFVACVNAACAGC